ncbi:MAG: DUF6282 family protein [Lachnospiraceae bacterium]|nr:DUF6282 family protein [Lachnospiraceae bacterium]
MGTNYLDGVIDTHVHSSPDVRQRKMNDFEIMQESAKRNVRAVVIKSHHMETAARAALINEINSRCNNKNHFQMFGGITLNTQVGGLNPYAVEASLKLGGKIVWMPTLESEFSMKKQGKSGGVACVRNGRVVDELIPILRLIKDYEAALATGHLSPEEIFSVVETAKNMGMNKIIISHPESNLVGLTIEQQFMLARDYDVMLEHCYAQPVGEGKYSLNFETNLEAIKFIGSKNTIIATDAGQIQNPYWYDSLSESIKYLSDNGVSSKDLDLMTKVNPAKILGII